MGWSGASKAGEKELTMCKLVGAQMSDRTRNRNEQGLEISERSRSLVGTANS